MTQRCPSFKTMLIAIGLALLPCGCNLLIPLAILSNPKQKIAPEYDKLAGGRTLIMVWADSATLFDYPHVRFELASHVADKITAELQTVEVVDPVRVADWRERELDAALSPEAAGREFDADTVVYIELLRFQIRDAEAPDFLRARLEASVAAYDLRADPDEPKVYHLKPVEVIYPERGGILFNSTNSSQVRHTAYVLFAEQVARKFHEYEEVL